MELVDVIVLAKGNPGALTLLLKLYKHERYDCIEILRSLNITGWKIWFAFIEHCSVDFNKFIRCIESSCPIMRASIENEECRMDTLE